MLEQPNGSTLIAVGDVSGKGLKAAMTGVLAIGALRTLAFKAWDLPRLLTRLNTELVRASDGGFVTCLCVVLAPGGSMCIANAGHLAPFINGREFPTTGSLPLGIDLNTRYDESTLALEPGDYLTLLSDGVVEAQSRMGELFGFERTGQISTHTAKSIAEEAQRFGQTDDITVLTLNRLALA